MGNRSAAEFTPVHPHLDNQVHNQPNAQRPITGRQAQPQSQSQHVHNRHATVPIADNYHRANDASSKWSAIDAANQAIDPNSSPNYANYVKPAPHQPLAIPPPQPHMQQQTQQPQAQPSPANVDYRNPDPHVRLQMKQPHDDAGVNSQVNKALHDSNRPKRYSSQRQRTVQHVRLLDETGKFYCFLQPHKITEICCSIHQIHKLA